MSWAVTKCRWISSAVFHGDDLAIVLEMQNSCMGGLIRSCRPET